jgi:dTDP-4-amino-4,6-dideoxygalactose transaminase
MINIFQPSLGKEELSEIEKVFESNWLGRGKQVAEFEYLFSKNLKESSDSFYALSCCTEGLFMAAKIFNFGPGDEIIVPSVSFIAAGSAVVESGAKLVICDVDKHSLNTTAEHIKEKISNKTKAIILNHYGGHPCDMDPIMELAKANNIFVIEDSACAVQSFYKGKACGTIGDMGIWSFDAMKSIVTGDGGMVYLKSNKLLNQLKEECYLGLPAKSTSGIDKSSDNSDIWWEVQINRPGRRSIMNNISAAMGIIQMNKLDAFQARRKFIYESYNIGFKENKFIQTPPNLIKDCTNSYYFYWIQLEKRNELAKYLKERDIYTTYRYWALNDVDYFNIKDKSLPNTDFASSKTLNLPLHPSLSDADIIKVINSVNEFFS